VKLPELALIVGASAASAAVRAFGAWERELPEREAHAIAVFLFDLMHTSAARSRRALEIGELDDLYLGVRWTERRRRRLNDGGLKLSAERLVRRLQSSSARR